MTSEEFLKLYNDWDGEPEDGAENDTTVVSISDWEIDYKDYANKTIIYKVCEQYFSILRSRSGSYYTDYNYDDPTCAEVEPVQVTITQYVEKP